MSPIIGSRLSTCISITIVKTPFTVTIRVARDHATAARTTGHARRRAIAGILAPAASARRHRTLGNQST
jgi:hypothetical protein